MGFGGGSSPKVDYQALADDYLSAKSDVDKAYNSNLSSAKAKMAAGGMAAGSAQWDANIKTIEDAHAEDLSSLQESYSYTKLKSLYDKGEVSYVDPSGSRPGSSMIPVYTPYEEDFDTWLQNRYGSSADNTSADTSSAAAATTDNTQSKAAAASALDVQTKVANPWLA